MEIKRMRFVSGSYKDKKFIKKENVKDGCANMNRGGL